MKILFIIFLRAKSATYVYFNCQWIWFTGTMDNVYHDVMKVRNAHKDVLSYVSTCKQSNYVFEVGIW